MVLVSVPTIAEASLCRRKPWLFRPYGFPFLILYPIFAWVYFTKYDEYIGGGEWTYVYLGSLASFQLLLWLMPFWNVALRSKFETNPAGNIEEAELIKLIPAASNGVPGIVPLAYDQDGELGFTFHKRDFIYDKELGTFAPLDFLVDQEGITVGAFQSLRGLKSSEIPALQKKYGLNKFDIPVPAFLELWKEHIVAPFFVFQLFCIALWILDDKWYLSLLNLAMVFGFESTAVWQRQRTMNEFRGIAIKPFPVFVYRDSKWVEIQSDNILPGDIVSINRTAESSGLPCDFILVNGTAIVNEAMLSGESTPLLKESTATRAPTAELDLEGLDKNSLLYGGTKVLQSSYHEQDATLPPAPDKGALAVATRTGFETSQGTLVRVMVFSTEQVGAGNKQAYFFILFLLMFAIAASWYVWTEGVKMDRKRSKLLLDCILIITSVVPPELPMELTLLVNSALNTLQSKYFIYCTEPFRLPHAGRLDVCCFDKTGTLTAEDLTVEGVAGLLPDYKLTPVKDVPSQSAQVLAAAHALVLLDDGDVVGDPMEQNTLKALGWKVEKNDVIRSSEKSSNHLQILKRFQFSSALKRSSSIAKLADGRHLVAVKGAPETLQKMLERVPDDYEDVYKHFTRNGSRVLAFAYKFPEVLRKTADVVKYSRESAESQLTFAGFLIFHSPLKDDAIETVKSLSESSHRVVMITGDNPLTAVKVSEQVGITDRAALILDAPEDGPHELVWQNVEGTFTKPVSPDGSLEVDLFKSYDLCVTGYALSRLQEHKEIEMLIRHTWVYARVSPAQKEFIVSTLRDMGYVTLMCGDGTNDVGALKQADLGIALLNGTTETMKKIMETTRIEMAKKVYDKQVDLMARWNGAPPPVPKIIAHLYPPGPKNPHYIAAIEARGGTIDEDTRKEIERIQAAAAEASALQEQQPAAQAAQLADKITEMLGEDENEPPALKLGDASVAAPLTSKLANVSAVLHVVRQGRSTLVATLQMYKILSLNCLISAYSLSVLYLAGIKIGDMQATVSGILLSVCFASISRSKIVEKLSKERPHDGIFNVYTLGSVLSQFAVHIATLVYVSREVYALEPKIVKIDLDKKFEPSLLNTAIFLLQLIQQISTFAVNYQGRPFREGLTENKGMYYGILGVAGLGFAGATEFFPEMNQALSLVKMTNAFKTMLTVTMFLDFGLCYVIEYTFRHLFWNYHPSDIATPLHERQSYVQYRKTR